MAVLLHETLAGGVRLLTLNRPKQNPFDAELGDALSAAVKEAEGDPAVRALVLRGTGAVFSAGLDFKALMQSQMQAGGEHFGTATSQALADVWTCPKPTVAAVTGHAIAFGFFAAVACDFRYVLEGPGKYGMNELSFGAGFPLLSIEIGRFALQRHMATAILSAELFDWREGLRNGTFHASFASEEQLMAAAVSRAAQIGAMPREAYAHVKEQLLRPYVERWKAETPAQQQVTAAIYRSDESMQALMQHASRLSRK